MAEFIDCEQLRDRAAHAFDSGQLLEALQAIDPVLASGQASVEDWLFTGQVLIQVREYAQAIQVLLEGLLMEPNHTELQYEIAKARFQLGDVPAATAEFERLARESGWPQAWSSLATIIPGCPTADNARILDVRRSFAAELAKEAALDSTSSDSTTLKPAVISQPTLKTSSSGLPHRIRLGYVSSFFHRANYMKPVWGLINGHDRQRFEIELFADDCQVEQFDWLRHGAKDRIHITSHLDNTALANLLRDRSLDIVIDLNAYSVVPRLGLYTRRLAPAVIAWFNMYATSALPGIDWIVGDEHVVRAEEDIWYTERVFRLPCSYLAFVVGHRAPDIVPPPCLTDEVFTFGSLVSQYKITPSVLDSWSEILCRAKNSRLLLANRAMQSTMNRDYVIAEFSKRGISDDRLRLLPPADHLEYLQYYNQIDLALDAFPYNGGTTTTEAIWQGVPVLAFDGDRWAARTSRTLLKNCHLSEFVATNQRDWIEAAVQWATSPDSPQRLHAIRSTMRDKLLESDVCKMPQMVRAMEEFFCSIAKKSW